MTLLVFLFFMRTILAYDVEITFSEYPMWTAISNQYESQGIIFNGDSPFITSDGANPTSPILSGTPLFSGRVGGQFTNPVNSFQVEAGDGWSHDITCHALALSKHMAHTPIPQT